MLFYDKNITQKENMLFKQVKELKLSHFHLQASVQTQDSAVNYIKNTPVSIERNFVV